jgi:hypothetical protein
MDNLLSLCPFLVTGDSHRPHFRCPADREFLSLRIQPDIGIDELFYRVLLPWSVILIVLG